MALRIEVTDEMKRSFRANGFTTSAGPVVPEVQLATMRAAYDVLYGGHAWYGEKRGLVQVFSAGKLAPGLIADSLFEACNAAAVELLAALDGLHPAFGSDGSAVVPRSSSHTMGCICKPPKTSEFTVINVTSKVPPMYPYLVLIDRQCRWFLGIIQVFSGHFMTRLLVVTGIPLGRGLLIAGGGAAGSDRVLGVAGNHTSIRLHVLRAGILSPFSQSR